MSDLRGDSVLPPRRGVQAGAPTGGVAASRGVHAFRHVSAALIPALGLAAGLAAPPPGNALELRVLAREGVVREAPDPNARAVATVAAGTPLRVLEEMQAWYLVVLPREADEPAVRGYVSWSDAEWVAECDPKAADQLKPGEVFRDCDVAPSMIVVPAGKFVMGSPASEASRRPTEGPQREVTIPAPFSVGVFEVTFEEWDNCVRMGGCGGLTFDDDGYGRGRRPALSINWHAARLYVQWLSELTGKRYRLLTEAEWEYAARAGSTTPTYWQPGEDSCTFANVYDESADGYHDFEFHFEEFADCNDGFPGTAPVGSFRPNAFGLYDMIGNASEWTQDCFNSDYSGGPTDGRAWKKGLCFLRVARGGSWFHGMENNRSATRSPRMPQTAASVSGFRVARDLE